MSRGTRLLLAVAAGLPTRGGLPAVRLRMVAFVALDPDHLVAPRAGHARRTGCSCSAGSRHDRTTLLVSSSVAASGLRYFGCSCLLRGSRARSCRRSTARRTSACSPCSGWPQASGRRNAGRRHRLDRWRRGDLRTCCGRASDGCPWCCSRTRSTRTCCCCRSRTSAASRLSFVIALMNAALVWRCVRSCWGSDGRDGCTHARCDPRRRTPASALLVLAAVVPAATLR